MAVEFGLGIFKSLLDSAKGLKDINDATVRNAVSIELQEKVLAAHAQQSTLIERVHELESRVAELEAWEGEKQQYELQRLPAGTFARAKKAGVSDSEPPHYICPNCYEDKKKLILQPSGRFLICHGCKDRIERELDTSSRGGRRGGGYWTAM